MATTNVFLEILGERYASLPAAVRALHDAAGSEIAGEVHVVRGTNPLAALACRIAGLPPSFRDEGIRATRTGFGVYRGRGGSLSSTRRVWPSRCPTWAN